jgi:hypothetical protein
VNRYRWGVDSARLDLYLRDRQADLSAPAQPALRSCTDFSYSRAPRSTSQDARRGAVNRNLGNVVRLEHSALAYNARHRKPSRTIIGCASAGLRVCVLDLRMRNRCHAHSCSLSDSEPDAESSPSGTAPIARDSRHQRTVFDAGYSGLAKAPTCARAGPVGWLLTEIDSVLR